MAKTTNIKTSAPAMDNPKIKGQSIWSPSVCDDVTVGDGVTVVVTVKLRPKTVDVLLELNDVWSIFETTLAEMGVSSPG